MDRLSVTFADDSIKSDSTRYNFIPSTPTSPNIMENAHQPTTSGRNTSHINVVVSRLLCFYNILICDLLDADDTDEEDYSASVNAIIQRRASTRRSKKCNRRASSPFSLDLVPTGLDETRRRSSVFTTSSGE